MVCARSGSGVCIDSCSSFRAVSRIGHESGEGVVEVVGVVVVQ